MKTISIAGNVGKDATLRQTTGGDEVLGFSVAVEERGREKRIIWFDCSVWGKRASALLPYIVKGTRVAVSGEFSTRENESRTYLTVRANEVTLLGDAAPRAPAQAPARGGAGSAPTWDGDEDDVPFVTSAGLF